MRVTEVSFPCGELLLEGRLDLPEGPGPFPLVVVCHPHPLYGGSMDNNVVNSLCEALVSASLASLKFNFRGVGQSQGTHGQGVGEQEDVTAAISYASHVAEADSERIGLAGYSAGAEYSHSVGVRDERVKALVLISPPVTMSDFDVLKDSIKPKFLASGSRDDIIPVNQFLDFCQELPEPKECHCIESADHFWWGHEKSLSEKAAAFFTRALNV